VQTQVLTWSGKQVLQTPASPAEIPQQLPLGSRDNCFTPLTPDVSVSENSIEERVFSTPGPDETADSANYAVALDAHTALTPADDVAAIYIGKAFKYLHQT